MPSLSQEQVVYLQECVKAFEDYLSQNVDLPLQKIMDLGRFFTTPTAGFWKKLIALREALQTKPIGSRLQVDERVLPMLKLVILHERRRLAAELEQKRTRISDPDLVEMLDQQLSTFDALMEQGWIHT